GRAARFLGGGGRLPDVLDLAAQPLDQHARLRELSLPLDEIALQRLLRLPALLDLSLEVLELLLQLRALLAQARRVLVRRAMPRRDHLAVVLGRSLALLPQPRALVLGDPEIRRRRQEEEAKPGAAVL